jgi:hypothetical protein
MVVDGGGGGDNEEREESEYSGPKQEGRSNGGEWKR